MAIFLRDGDEPVEFVGRDRLDKSAARRMMIKEMVIMRHHGYTYREIALKYRMSYGRVHDLINGTPEHVKQRLRTIDLA